MAEGEKIDLKKAVTSPFTGLYWVKTIMYCLGACMLLMVGFAIYKAYFKKPPPTQTQHIETITVESGGTLTLQNQTQTETKKRPWWRPYIFAEPYAFSETTGENIRSGVGARGGLRWEF